MNFSVFGLRQHAVYSTYTGKGKTTCWIWIPIYDDWILDDLHVTCQPCQAPISKSSPHQPLLMPLVLKYMGWQETEKTRRKLGSGLLYSGTLSMIQQGDGFSVKISMNDPLMT